MIPANPETYVIEAKGGASLGYVKEPVIGFTYAKGEGVTVITAHGENRVLRGSALLFPCGAVSDPSGFTFDDVEEWLASDPNKPKNPAPVAAKTAKPTGAEAPDADVSGSPYDIEWTDKQFKNNTFWHYDDGENQFVYQVDGETDAPKATSKNTKIKRTDMMELKKSIDLLTVEQIMTADPLPVPDDGGEELPEDEEEDDSEDLI